MYNNNRLINEVRSKINVVEGDEFKETLQAVSHVVSEILAKTLGPLASTTAIDGGDGFTFPTKDGWHVITNLTISDPIMSAMLKFIKDISFTLNSKVGDGTTTAVVTANKFIEYLYDYLEKDNNKNGFRQADLLNAMDVVKNEIIEELHSESRVHTISRNPETNSFDDIYKIAMIASNGNELISSIIRKIYDETENPDIYVTAIGGENVTSYEIQKGYRIDSKLCFAHYFFNTDEKTVRLVRPTNVVIFNHNVTYVDHARIIQDIINMSLNDGKELVVFAPYFDEPFTSVFKSQIERNVLKGATTPVMFVQVAMSNPALKNYASDFACIVGAEMFDYAKVRMYNQLYDQLNGKDPVSEEFADLAEKSGFHTTSDIIESSIATVKSLVITEKYTLIEDFDTTAPLYQATLREIKEEDERVTKKYMKTLDLISTEYMNAHMRYIKFLGNSGIIKVGGEHDIVKQCNKDTIDDAVLACRSAYRSGYIRGFNVETISAAREVAKHHDPLSAEHACAWLIASAFNSVSLEVMRNKYQEYADMDDFNFLNANLWKTNEFDKRISAYDIFETCVNDNKCYNIVTETFEPAGTSVINSVSTDTEILNAVTSILSLIVSSNQLLSINKQFDKKVAIDNMLEMKTEEYTAVGKGLANGFASVKPGIFDIMSKMGSSTKEECETLSESIDRISTKIR